MQLHAMEKLSIGWTRPKGSEHGAVLCSRARLARNLEDKPFPGRLSPQDLKSVLDEAFAASDDLKGAAKLRLSDLDGTDRRFLVERHLISPDLEAHPAARGVVIGTGETLSLMVNEEDHLRISALAPGLSLHEAYGAAAAAATVLSRRLRFAYREDFGYLTACPTNLGTGLRASCLLHLPALTHSGSINALLARLPRLGLNARGLYGEGTKVMGDLYQIANAGGFGRTEGELLAAVSESARRIALAENKTRTDLLSRPESKRRTEDSVFRAAGILTNARLVSFEEACRHLSLLRLGLVSELPGLPGSLAEVNMLLVQTQPAHIEMRENRELSPAERDELRATRIRERLD